MTTSDLVGVTAVVTGASRGFGRAIAIDLAGAGADAGRGESAGPYVGIVQ